MIKNQLYPFVESYINKYLWGFTKEQFDIGVTNGNISLNDLNIRPDTFNNFCDEKNYPFWLKFGQIKNVNVTCSLMNIIGEKPLDVTIENVYIILCPSYKYINIDHTLGSINKIDYINQKTKVNIFDSNLNVENDDSFIDKLLFNIYKFYNSKKYYLNLTIKKFQIRFEDDTIMNPNGDFCFGLTIDEALLNLSTEGLLKNYSFNINNLNFFFDNHPNVVTIPTSVLVQNLYDLYKYYGLIRTYPLDLSSKSKADNVLKIISNFSFRGNCGTKKIGKFEDVIIKQESSDIVYLNIFFNNALEISIFPSLIATVRYIKNFVENFEILQYAKTYRTAGKLNRTIDLLNYVCLIRRMKRVKHENLVKKEYNRYMGLYGYDKINRTDEKKIGDDIIISKKNQINIESYPIFGIDYKKLNVTPQGPSEKEEILKLMKTKRLTCVFKMIVPEFSFNICNANSIKCFSFTGNTIEINSQISKILFELKYQMANFTINAEETYNTLDKNIPNFQYNIQKKKENKFPIQKQKGIYEQINSRVNFFKAGLKESSLYSESKAVQDSNTKIYKENARYLRKMKILTDTLRVARDTSKTPNSIKNHPSINAYYKQNQSYYTVNFPRRGNNINNYREFRPGNFISKVLGDNNDNVMDDMLQRNKSQTNIRRVKQNKALSKIINDYNTQKLNIINSSFNNNNVNVNLDASFTSNNIAPLYRAIMNNNLNNSNLNNSNVSFINQNNQSQSQAMMKSPSEVYSLPFLLLTSENKNNLITIHLIKHLREKEVDSLKINIPIIRLNFFKEYFVSIFSVLLEYHVNLLKKKIKSQFLIHILTQNIHYHKALYLVRKYINETISHEVNVNNGFCYNQLYFDYIKKVYTKYPLMADEFETFASNYLFSYYFSSNLEVDFSYQDFNFIFYKYNVNNLYNHQIFAHSKVQKADFKLFYSLSYLYLKLFEIELEVSEYDGVYEMIEIMKIEIGNKLSLLNKYFTKAFTEIRNDEQIQDLIIQLKNKDNNIDIDTERNSTRNYQKYKIEIVKKKEGRNSSNSKVPRSQSKEETTYTSSNNRYEEGLNKTNV